MINQVLSYIGAVVIGGGALVTVVWQAFKHLSVKWLDARFDERLQKLRHDHNQEIEHLRFRISALLDRATKLHEREFEVLPKAWAKLNEAYWYVSAFVSSMQSYPDLDRMSEAQLNEFIDSCPLHGWQRAEVIRAEEKTKLYQRHIFWHKLGEAQSKARDSHVYTAKNGIFVKQDIREKISKLNDLVWDALTQHQMNEEHDFSPRNREKIGLLNAEGGPLIKDLEREIHNRLWPASGAELVKDTAVH